MTSKPTVDGDTNPPSRPPTAIPTVNMNYQLAPSYLDYVASLPKYTSISQSYTYGSYYYKGVTVDGTCSNWKSFTQNTLSLPFDDVYFSKMSVKFRYTGSGMYAAGANTTLTCSDRTVIAPLIASMYSGVTYSGNCAGNTWRVFTCDTNRIFCVNCKINCVTDVICPGTGFVISSCSTCKTHAASYGIVNMQYTVEKLYPQFLQPLNVTAARDRITVAMNVSKAGNVYCASLPRTSAAPTTVVTIKSSGATAIALAPRCC